MSDLPVYAELHCLSAFSFQRGASIAPELFERAKQLGYSALAITDEGSLAGIVRALEASRKFDLKLIVGSEVQIFDGPKLVLLAETRPGYTTLCQLLTRARRRAPKGQYRLLREDFAGTDGLLALWVPGLMPDEAEATWTRTAFPQRTWLAVELHRGPDDEARIAQLRGIGARLQLPLVAAGDVHMHVRGRRALQDTMTAIRHKTTVARAGHRLFPNGERHLRARRALAAIYPADLLAETVRIAERCTFKLDQLQYEYPHELVPAGHDPASWLRQLVEQGARWRWPAGIGQRAHELIEHELALVAHKRYESYFLTVHDIVRFARSQNILCQGRGSAANSVICYVLGVTEIDPVRMNMLFERFISKERDEPPDIDIDFEHERREEVLQYVFNRYGRERAALTAVAPVYRGRGAVRDVGRALGLPQDMIGELSSTLDRWSGDTLIGEHLRERGYDPGSPLLRQVITLAAQLIGFPRHLSQHPGGFVISEHPLHTLVPVENAAMDDRTVIQWDKDDLDVLGLLKVDCLALGMLTAVRKTLDLLRDSGRRDMSLGDIPAEDRQTYGMISRADTVGVFQIESRAQMAMLPRMRPKTFYDLVIQVAIVRPGPIQGDMVHPYLQRRNGLEPVHYPSDKLKSVLQRTLGIPLFQEQVMQIAMVAADFTAGEADQLRRSMAAWKRHGGLEPHRQRLLDGMLRNGYSREYAERIFEQIKGFGSYGFPESHAASFALIAYTSSWLKCHEPAAFACALINSWPMGFYSPDQLLQDARRHGVRTLPLDVRYSGWDCSLEEDQHPLGAASATIGNRRMRTDSPSRLKPLLQETARENSLRPQPAIRLGLRLIRGLPEDAARRIERARAQRPFEDVAGLCARADLDRRAQSVLADAGALRGLVGHRHRARWAITGVEPQLPLFATAPAAKETENIVLPLPSADEDMRADYAMTGTTLGRHPLSFLRKALSARRYRRSAELAALPHGRHVRVAGLVTLRQKPQTASGVIFLTLEDEDGMTNVVIWRDLAERQRRVLLESRLLAVEGRLECQHGVMHLIAKRLDNLTPLLGTLETRSRDFH
ncbi:error-prone DNA polymerase [Lysobacter sp. D1-1-M9]|uniref:error-prone DNA polymerase n=1 Tax=Novilysobacter longmucuonensis TaxID=3098603 RepID=UPI002FCADC77